MQAEVWGLPELCRVPPAFCDRVLCSSPTLGTGSLQAGEGEPLQLRVCF